MEDKPDFGSTTAVFAYVRKRITPKVLWSAIVALVTTLIAVITYVNNAQATLRDMHDQNLRNERRIEALESQKDILNDIKTQVAVMSTKVDTIAAEQERQQKWRDHLAEIAEAPPRRRVAR